MQFYEKLGTFYLGREYDQTARSTTDDLLLYDAKDLTTHGLCVGMTGSGKTGLCLTLLEEALMDGIPVLAIDPKGDLANLKLTFPELKAADFKPWIDPAEAARKDMSVSDFSAHEAAKWRDGLASWDQDGERIARLLSTGDVKVYTPGSDAGIQLALLRSLKAPPRIIQDDSEAFQDRIETVVSGLLALLEIDADPLTSREHVLLSTIIGNAWSESRDLSMADLIRLIQTPGFTQLGVMSLDAFFPEKERFGLAIRLNAVLASPAFATWMTGVPLDVNSLLYCPDGRPQIAVISIAHLSDAERMFFVSTLLNEFLAWVRSQPGSSSLRALLYLDEIYGVFPPTANPPSKKPMLTLLKQARAYGVGVLMATQNPVDLDYKGLSNVGTWFIGRLQTERDTDRIMAGLEGASKQAGNAFDASAVAATIAGLGKRVFYLHNTHETEPVLFQTRWAMSYLSGPMSKDQLRRLKALEPENAPPPLPVQAAPVPAVSHDGAVTERMALPSGIEERFQATAADTEGQTVCYRPALFVKANMRYVRAKLSIDEWQSARIIVPFLNGEDPDFLGSSRAWHGGIVIDDGPLPDAEFLPLPASAGKAITYRSWRSRIKQALVEAAVGKAYYCRPIKLGSQLNQNEASFRGQIRHVLREQRDHQLDLLRGKYEDKIDRIQERMRKARQRIEREQQQYEAAKMSVAVSFGTTMLRALMGRRSALTSASRSARGVSRSAKQRGDVTRAREDLAELETQILELDVELAREVDKLQDAFDPATMPLDEIVFKPRKTGMEIVNFGVLWQPYAVEDDGSMRPLFEDND
jgi:DNA helicase HerA-like ATPase